MRITIIAVGKVKEKFYRDAIAEFESTASLTLLRWQTRRPRTMPPKRRS